MLQSSCRGPAERLGQRLQFSALLQFLQCYRLCGGRDGSLVRIARHAILNAVFVVRARAGGGYRVQLFQGALCAEDGQDVGDRLAALDVYNKGIAAPGELSEQLKA